VELLGNVAVDTATATGVLCTCSRRWYHADFFRDEKQDVEAGLEPNGD